MILPRGMGSPGHRVRHVSRGNAARLATSFLEKSPAKRDHLLGLTERGSRLALLRMVANTGTAHDTAALVNLWRTLHPNGRARAFSSSSPASPSPFSS